MTSPGVGCGLLLDLQRLQASQAVAGGRACTAPYVGGASGRREARLIVRAPKHRIVATGDALLHVPIRRGGARVGGDGGAKEAAKLARRDEPVLIGVDALP